jgi:hypothetical protein
MFKGCFRLSNANVTSPILLLLIRPKVLTSRWLLRTAALVAGRLTLMGSLLQKEFAKVKVAISQRLEHGRDLTLSTLSWSSLQGSFAYGINANFIGGSVELLDVGDLDSQSVTGVAIAGNSYDGPV